jgi:hypothetical protein
MAQLPAAAEAAARVQEYGQFWYWTYLTNVLSC